MQPSVCCAPYPLSCRFVPNQPLPFHQLSPVSVCPSACTRVQLTCAPLTLTARNDSLAEDTCVHYLAQHVPAACVLPVQGDVVLLSREAASRGGGRGAGAGKALASPVDADSAFEAVILDYRWGREYAHSISSSSLGLPQPLMPAKA
jgi:hypothetical protein